MGIVNKNTFLYQEIMRYQYVKQTCYDHRIFSFFISPPITAVTTDACRETPATEDNKKEQPRGFDQHLSGKLIVGNFPQKDGRRKVCKVLQRQQLHEPLDRIRQQREGKHVAAEKKATEHVDKQQRTDFEKPEANHANRSFEKIADEKAHD